MGTGLTYQVPTSWMVISTMWWLKVVSSHVGGAPGKVNLFRGQECVERGVPTAAAVDRLVELIKKHGRWVEPPQ